MARVSGLVSGLDTDALIQELVSAYQTKQETYVKKQTKLEWTQEIWKGLNSKVYSFYTGALRNARFSSAYDIKKATISDSTKATVTASSNAVVGTQTLNVKKLAKTAYLTGGKLQRKYKSDGTTADTTSKLSGNSRLKELGFNDSNGTIKVNSNGKETEISVNGETTINQFVVKLKDAGLTASFDEVNQRLFVSASGSGAGKEFSIMAANENGLKALGSLGLNSVSKSNGDAYETASKINVQQATGTAYTKYVLTQANAQHTADINDKNIQINALKDQLKYINEPDYKAKLDKSWADSIQSYQDKNSELQDIIQKQLDYTGNDSATITKSVGDFLKKDDADSTKYALDSDGQYSLADKYYKTDADGERVLDKDALEADLENTGLTSDQVLAQLGEINANVSAIAKNTALEQSVAETRDLYAAAVTKGETAINQEIDKLTAEIADIQKEINTNNEWMKGTYAFEDASGAAVTGTAHTVTNEDGTTTDWSYQDLTNRLNKYTEVKLTYGELADKLDKGEVAGTDVAYTKDDGTDVTYQEIQDGINSGTYLAGQTAYEGNSIGSTGLKAGQGYVDLYKGYENKYQAEKDMGEKLYQAYQQYTKDGATDAEKAAAAATLGLDTSTNGAVRVEGQDAEIILNGATYTSTTNNFAINGLTITATGEMKEGDEITISTTADIDGMYNSIKSLIGGFNDLLKEMNTLYYASSAKGYEPLSDAEKEALTDTEVEKWEKKIKDSLLRRDGTLNSIMSVMKNSMAKSYTINGKSYSLSTFGISTSGYFAVDNEERGLYHIDGDPDDTTSSGNKDKLRAALASDPDAVIQFFQKISDDMYTQLTKKMARTSLSSSYTIYNDKQMEKQYRDYSQIIDDWDEKIEKYTQKYVKQFTAMETAMAKLQSSTSALAGLLG